MPAVPPVAPAQQPGPSGFPWPLLIGMLVIMYFMVIRPERKERKRKESLVSAC